MSGRTRGPSTSALAGASAGFVSSVVTCPLDVLKTRLQAEIAGRGQAGYLGLAGTIKDIHRYAGLRGFYVGLGPTMLGYLPTWAIYFSVYDGVKNFFGESSLGGRHSLNNWGRNSWAIHILASLTAGATSTISTSPLWVIKTRVMAQLPGEARYRHTLDAFITTYRNDGWKAFYRGLLPSLLGVTHVAIQFPLYERLKLFFSQRQDPSLTSLPLGTTLVCTTISKCTASIITYPHEVVRTRLQITRQPSPTVAMHPATAAALNSRPLLQQHLSMTATAKNNAAPPHRPPRGPWNSTVRMIKRIAAEEGWRGFYKGLSINLLRTIPNTAVTLVTYEWLMQQLTLDDDHR